MPAPGGSCATRIRDGRGGRGISGMTEHVPASEAGRREPLHTPEFVREEFDWHTTGCRARRPFVGRDRSETGRNPLTQEEAAHENTRLRTKLVSLSRDCFWRLRGLSPGPHERRGPSHRKHLSRAVGLTVSWQGIAPRWISTSTIPGGELAGRPSKVTGFSFYIRRAQDRRIRIPAPQRRCVCRREQLLENSESTRVEQLATFSMCSSRFARTERTSAPRRRFRDNPSNQKSGPARVRGEL